ncbi:MAG: PAS domain-containing protein [Coprococcus sp.]
MTREYRRRKNMLSPFSVKDATDKLPMGVCFADPNGRIVLCNDRMRRLSFALSGHEFQITDDLEKALEHPDKSIIANGDCYILPDKTVWQFRKQNITVDNDENWLQMTAHNVTELYNGNVRQTAINDELKEVNRKLQKCMNEWPMI